MFFFIFTKVNKILKKNPQEIDCFQKYSTEGFFFLYKLHLLNTGKK